MKLNLFIDMEFSEGFFKPIWWLPAIWFNKKRWSIELISIGIQCEDGRRYYAINDNFSTRRCNEWVKKNVIPQLPPYIQRIEHTAAVDFDMQPMFFPVTNPQYKSVSEIKLDILRFTQGYDPIFYTYFGAYDWILLCTIFGTMDELPHNFPMLGYDIKQEFDNVVRAIAENETRIINRSHKETESQFSSRLEKVSKQLQSSVNYPPLVSEHSALADASWNYELFKFLKIVKQSL